MIETHDKIQTLATANGSKTISQLITEAQTALHAIIIPENYAYEIKQIVCPTGDNTIAQIGLDINYGSASLVNNLSNYNLRAYKIMDTAFETISIYSLYFPDINFKVFSININSKQITGGSTYATQKPSSGTTLYIRYNIWKKI